jgi:hypothetical protein
LSPLLLLWLYSTRFGVPDRHREITLETPRDRNGTFYHRHYGTTGHVWQGRFKAFRVQEDEHLATVLRYVERNALRAEVVSRAEDWNWSSLQCWQRRDPISWQGNARVRHDRWLKNSMRHKGWRSPAPAPLGGPRPALWVRDMDDGNCDPAKAGVILPTARPTQ